MARLRNAPISSPTAASSSTSTTPTPPCRRARVDARVLDPRPPTAAMRQDVLTGDWVSIAAARQNRVFLPPAELDPLAPQTPDNPSEMPSLYDVAVFENRSPSFGPDARRRTAPRPDGLDDLARVGLGRTRSPSAAARSCASAPSTRDRSARSSLSRARTVIEAWADRTAALSALPGVAAGVPVREPRGGDRRHAAPPARPDLRVPVRHAAHERAARVDRRVRRPTCSADILEFERNGPARAPRGRALDRVRAVRRALAASRCTSLPHRHVPDFAATTEEERDELARALPAPAARRRRALRAPPPRTSRPGTRRPCTRGATSVRLHAAAHLARAAPPTSSSTSPAPRPPWAPGSATSPPRPQPRRLREAIEREASATDPVSTTGRPARRAPRRRGSRVLFAEPSRRARPASGRRPAAST